MKIIIFAFISYLFFLPSVLQDAQATPNIYDHAQFGMFSPEVNNALYRVYVPNSKSNTVSVIDPKSYVVVNTFFTGKNPQHVVPSYDLQTLYVLNNKSNS